MNPTSKRWLICLLLFLLILGLIHVHAAGGPVTVESSSPTAAEAAQTVLKPMTQSSEIDVLQSQKEARLKQIPPSDAAVLIAAEGIPACAVGIHCFVLLPSLR
jgi:hypothetical protein